MCKEWFSSQAFLSGCTELYNYHFSNHSLKAGTDHLIYYRMDAISSWKHPDSHSNKQSLFQSICWERGHSL